MRAKMLFPVSGDFWKDYWDKGNRTLPTPPSPWFVRGPRGGVYEAIGWIRMKTSNFVRNQIAVMYESEGARYLRPGTRRHRDAIELLDHAITSERLT